VGGMNPVSMRMVVDFPAPLGPRKPSTSPRSTENETSFTASFVPKLLTRFSTLIIPSSGGYRLSPPPSFSRPQICAACPVSRAADVRACFDRVFRKGSLRHHLRGPGPLWCRQSDSNRRPTAYKAVALPLSYVGSGRNYSAVPRGRHRGPAPARRPRGP